MSDTSEIKEIFTIRSIIEMLLLLAVLAATLFVVTSLNVIINPDLVPMGLWGGDSAFSDHGAP